MGGRDFLSGRPAHLSSGTAALISSVYFRRERIECGGWILHGRYRRLGLASGFVGSREFLTPSSALYPYQSTSRPATAVCFNVIAGALCNFATQLKFLCRYGHALDVSDRSEKLNVDLVPFFRSSRPVISVKSLATPSPPFCAMQRCGFRWVH